MADILQYYNGLLLNDIYYLQGLYWGIIWISQEIPQWTVTQNNTGIYKKESSQQSFQMQNNNLDVGFKGSAKMKLPQQ